VFLTKYCQDDHQIKKYESGTHKRCVQSSPKTLSEETILQT